MPKIKVPGSGDHKENPPAASPAKRHVRLKNAHPVQAAKERLLVARAKRMARRRLRKAVSSFEEAFGASDEEVSRPNPPPGGLCGALVVESFVKRFLSTEHGF